MIKRPSPSDSAQKNPDKIMIGNDDYEYVSRQDKNGIYKWHKIVWKNTAEEHYMQFPENYLNKKFYKYKTTNLLKKFEKIKNELKKYNILFFEIKWKNVYNFIDYAWEEADKIAKDNSPFIFYTNHSLFWSKKTGEINIKWDLPKKKFEIVNKLFKNVFRNKYIEPKNKNKAIIIKL